MEFTDSADDGKVKIVFLLYNKRSYGFKKVHNGIKKYRIYFYLLI